MRTEGFKLSIPASKRPQTHTPDDAAIGIGIHVHLLPVKFKYFSNTIKIFFFLALKK
jgi:hypothetical protein